MQSCRLPLCNGFCRLSTACEPLLSWAPHLLSAGSNTQLVDVSISNCIRSGINKM